MTYVNKSLIDFNVVTQVVLTHDVCILTCMQLAWLKWDTSHRDETLSGDKIDFKDANMGRAGRIGHNTHVSMTWAHSGTQTVFPLLCNKPSSSPSWTHVHNAVEMTRFFFSGRIRNSLAF